MSDPYSMPPQQPYYPQQPNYPPQQPNPYGYPPPPPVKKRRTGLIVGLVAAVTVVVLAACAGVVTLAVKLGSDRKATNAADEKPVTLTAPATIGALKKSSDQSQAQAMNKAMTNAGLDSPFAAVYQDTKNAGRRIVIWGGTGDIFKLGSEQKQLDGFFGGMSSQLGGTKPVTVDMGTFGGTAECAKSGLSGMKLSICAWTGNDALLGFLFNGVEPGPAGAQMLTMLPSIVTKG